VMGFFETGSHALFAQAGCEPPAPGRLFFFTPRIEVGITGCVCSRAGVPIPILVRSQPEDCHLGGYWTALPTYLFHSWKNWGPKSSRGSRDRSRGFHGCSPQLAASVRHRANEQERMLPGSLARKWREIQW
jgi:hypothetical protein